MMKLWTVKITTFLLWALAAGSAAFWILHTTNPAAGGTKVALAAPDAASEPNTAAKIASALGAKNAVAPTADAALAAAQSRLQLQGVVAVGSANGTALISVDGKPAKPYRVGSAIEDSLEVTSIKAREASIGANGAAAFTLELPLKDANSSLKK
jgi:general secretion pathway protein C